MLDRTNDVSEEVKETENKLKQALITLGNATIPAVVKCPAPSTNVTYTYYNYFGICCEEVVEVLMLKPESLKQVISRFDNHLARYKDPELLKQFKEDLAGHLRLPQYYPRVPEFIQDRENLAAELEPLMNAVKAAYDNYVSAKDRLEKQKLKVEDKEAPLESIQSERACVENTVPVPTPLIMAVPVIPQPILIQPPAPGDAVTSQENQRADLNAPIQQSPSVITASVATPDSRFFQPPIQQALATNGNASVIAIRGNDAKTEEFVSYDETMMSPEEMESYYTRGTTAAEYDEDFVANIYAQMTLDEVFGGNINESKQPGSLNLSVELKNNPSEIPSRRVNQFPSLWDLPLTHEDKKNDVIIQEGELIQQNERAQHAVNQFNHIDIRAHGVIVRAKL